MTKSMTTEQMQNQLCEWMPEYFHFNDVPYDVDRPDLVDGWTWSGKGVRLVDWEYEGLQVCKLACEKLSDRQWILYHRTCCKIINRPRTLDTIVVFRDFAQMPWEQKLEALSRTLWPEKFTP